MRNQGKRHDAAENEQADRLVAHSNRERGVLHFRPGSAEIMGGGGAWQIGEKTVGTGEFGVEKRADELDASGVATLQAELANLDQPKDDRGDNGERAHHLSDIGEGGKRGSQLTVRIVQKSEARSRLVR